MRVCAVVKEPIGELSVKIQEEFVDAGYSETEIKEIREQNLE